MRMIMDYIQLAAEGFGRFIAEYKYLALIIGILLYTLVCLRKYKEHKIRTFLAYTAAILLVLIIPVTAVVLLVYQTRFYDYGWVWSAAPLTAALAWGIVAVVFEEIPGVSSALPEHSEQKKTGKTVATRTITPRLLGILAAVSLLFMCGNQGRLQGISEKDAQLQAAGAEILQYMKMQDLIQDRVIWGQKDIMQHIRKSGGETILFYGRDMWDAKAGAYDYEAYTPEETACYEWMEIVSSSDNLYLLEVEQAPEYIHEALATDVYLREAIARDVDVIILASQITSWMERKILLVAEEKGLTVSGAQVGEYTLWIFD